MALTLQRHTCQSICICGSVSVFWTVDTNMMGYTVKHQWERSHICVATFYIWIESISKKNISKIVALAVSILLSLSLFDCVVFENGCVCLSLSLTVFLRRPRCLYLSLSVWLHNPTCLYPCLWLSFFIGLHVFMSVFGSLWLSLTIFLFKCVCKCMSMYVILVCLSLTVFDCLWLSLTVMYVSVCDPCTVSFSNCFHLFKSWLWDFWHF